jgi:hypothetical protein
MLQQNAECYKYITIVNKIFLVRGFEKEEVTRPTAQTVTNV